jgi:hypothetical protein
MTAFGKCSKDRPWCPWERLITRSSPARTLRQSGSDVRHQGGQIWAEWYPRLLSLLNEEKTESYRLNQLVMTC